MIRHNKNENASRLERLTRVGAKFTEYPELSKAAMYSGTYRNGLRYWYAINNMSKNLCNHEYEMPIVIEYLMRAFNITKRHAYKIIQINNGTFWKVTKSEECSTPGAVRVYSFQEVFKIFGIAPYADGWDSHVNCLRDGSSRQWSWQSMRRFYTYAAGTPVSRETLVKLTGIPRRTQQLYDMRLKEKRSTHIEVVDIYDTVEEARAAYIAGVEANVYKDHAYFAGAVVVDSTASKSEPVYSTRVIGVFRKMGNCYLSDRRRLKSGKTYEIAGYRNGAGVYFKGDCPKLRTLIFIINRGSGKSSYQAEQKATNFAKDRNIEPLWQVVLE